MSESENPNGAADKVLESRDGVNFVLRDFRDGNAKGFKFVVPQYTSIEAAVGKYTDKTVLDILNEALSNRVRNKIKNGMFNFPPNSPQVTRDALQRYINEHPDGIVFGINEADNWQPGVREDSFKGLQQKAVDALASGDEKLAIELLRKAMQKKQEKEALTAPQAQAT